MRLAQFVAQVQRTLEAQRNPERAAYMRDPFSFLGISRAEQRPLLVPLLHPLPKTATEAWALEVAQRLRALPERESQYVAAAILGQVQACLTPASLPMLEGLLTQKPWWDSVDALASKAVGALVLRYPELQRETDRRSCAGPRSCTSAQTDPAAVGNFVAEHRDTLSPLSALEAFTHNPSADSL